MKLLEFIRYWLLSICGSDVHLSEKEAEISTIDSNEGGNLCGTLAELLLLKGKKQLNGNGAQRVATKILRNESKICGGRRWKTKACHDCTKPQECPEGPND